MKNIDSNQLSIFGYNLPRKVINKPIRLIELFGGIGAQAKALTALGANYEHYRYVDVDKFAVKSYNAIHGTNFAPQDICTIKGSDLGINANDNREYVLTYSFPCTSLSLVGKRTGMTRGSETSSALLWEVERLLQECETLPAVLLMENVPQINDGVNGTEFASWISTLESLGYISYYAVLDAQKRNLPYYFRKVFQEQ